MDALFEVGCYGALLLFGLLVAGYTGEALSLASFAIALIMRYKLEPYDSEGFYPYNHLPRLGRSIVTNNRLLYTINQNWDQFGKPSLMSSTSQEERQKSLISRGYRTDGVSWYYGNDYYLDTYDEKNLNKLRQYRSEGSIFTRTVIPTVWIQCILAFLPCFYDITIVPFENMVMSDEAFEFVDFALYYLPFILILVIAFFAWWQRRKVITTARKYVHQIIDQNIMENQSLRTQAEIQAIQSSIWYYNTCPNCATEATPNGKVCAACGSSLQIDAQLQDIVDASQKHQVIEEKVNNEGF